MIFQNFIKKYTPPFLISVPLSFAWFFGVGSIGWIIGFGGGSPNAMKVWEIFYFAGYAFLVFLLVFLFGRSNQRNFWLTLVIAFLPGILFWGGLGLIILYRPPIS